MDGKEIRTCDRNWLLKLNEVRGKLMQSEVIS